MPGWGWGGARATTGGCPYRHAMNRSISPFLRRFHVLEHAQEGQVVDDFEAAGQDEGPAEGGVVQHDAGAGGTRAHGGYGDALPRLAPSAGVPRARAPEQSFFSYQFNGFVVVM